MEYEIIYCKECHWTMFKDKDGIYTCPSQVDQKPLCDECKKKLKEMMDNGR